MMVGQEKDKLLGAKANIGVSLLTSVFGKVGVRLPKNFALKWTSLLVELNPEAQHSAI